MKTKQDIIQRLLDYSNEIDRTAVIILEQQEGAIIENTRLGINIHLN